MKRAIVKVAAEILPQIAAVLQDHDLQIRTSVAPPGIEDYVMALVIEDVIGDKLPEQCSDGWWEVSVLVTQECVGRQKLVRITKIDAVRKIDFGPALAA